MIEKKDAERLKFSCTAMHNDGVHLFLNIDHTCEREFCPLKSGSCESSIPEQGDLID